MDARTHRQMDGQTTEKHNASGHQGGRRHNKTRKCLEKLPFGPMVMFVVKLLGRLLVRLPDRLVVKLPGRPERYASRSA